MIASNLSDYLDAVVLNLTLPNKESHCDQPRDFLKALIGSFR